MCNYHFISGPHLSTLSFLLLNDRLSSYQSFVDILNEMNDYAGQRELIAENMIMNICIDLTKYLQELKQERKTVSLMRSIKNALIFSHLRHAVDIKRLTRPDTVQFL